MQNGWGAPVLDAVTELIDAAVREMGGDRWWLSLCSAKPSFCRGSNL